MGFVRVAMSKSLEIGITLPASRGVGTGNLRTAQRWARIFTELGHEPRIVGPEDSLNCEVLIALNAVKSKEAIERYHHQNPRGRLVVAITGTDLNRRGEEAWENSMAWADRIVVLQDKALEALTPEQQAKAKVIVQSVSVPTMASSSERKEGFQVCVVGHFRKEKDPMLTAMASRMLDDDSQIQVLQAGAILEEEYTRAVTREREINPRYQWLGELTKVEALKLIADSDLMVLTSTSEGGPGVIGEAVVAGTPILATRIDGVVGLLGEDFPGYFEPGDVMSLHQLLKRVEKDADFYRELTTAGVLVRGLFAIEKEVESWRVMLGKVL